MTDFPQGVRPALLRLYYDIRYLAGRPATAPYGRLGIIDLLHAYSNVWTELARANSHAVGRGIAWTTPLWLYVAIDYFI